VKFSYVVVTVPTGLSIEAEIKSIVLPPTFASRHVTVAGLGLLDVRAIVPLAMKLYDPGANALVGEALNVEPLLSVTVPRAELYE
jgi:hypothetical protein